MLYLLVGNVSDKIERKKCKCCTSIVYVSDDSQRKK